MVVPWSERLRYGAKKNGYHGGVTPQEMLIPISMLWPKLQVPEGFEELPVELPSWWTEPMVIRSDSCSCEAPETFGEGDTAKTLGSAPRSPSDTSGRDIVDRGAISERGVRRAETAGRPRKH